MGSLPMSCAVGVHRMEAKGGIYSCTLSHLPSSFGVPPPHASASRLSRGCRQGTSSFLEAETVRSVLCPVLVMVGYYFCYSQDSTVSQARVRQLTVTNFNCGVKIEKIIITIEERLSAASKKSCGCPVGSPARNHRLCGSSLVSRATPCGTKRPVALTCTSQRCCPIPVVI